MRERGAPWEDYKSMEKRVKRTDGLCGDSHWLTDWQISILPFLSIKSVYNGRKWSWSGSKGDYLIMTRPEINFQSEESLFCRWGLSHAARFKVELRWDCFSAASSNGNVEEIDGGGSLFVCLIHRGRGGKKHWNINFLFAVFNIGRPGL